MEKRASSNQKRDLEIGGSLEGGKVSLGADGGPPALDGWLAGSLGLRGFTFARLGHNNWGNKTLFCSRWVSPVRFASWKQNQQRAVILLPLDATLGAMHVS